MPWNAGYNNQLMMWCAEGAYKDLDVDGAYLKVEFAIQPDSLSTSFSLTGNNIEVNWGDGSTTSNTSHTYNSPGIYIAKIKATNVTAISFFNNTNLTKIITPIPWNTLTDLGKCFCNCTSLTSIPDRFLNYCTEITKLCTNEGENSGCFENCTSLQRIPIGIFDKCSKITRFYRCFYNCKSITSIPTGLFDICTEAKDFCNCFSGCTSITSIPNGLFDNNTLVTTFSATFQSTAIPSIPIGLFDNNTLVTNFSTCFSNCRSLTSIPNGIFDNCTKANLFNSCFYGCKSLTSIPANLFSKQQIIAMLMSTFESCSSITSALPDLWNTRSTAVHNKCFTGCTQALNYQDAVNAGWA